MYAFPRERGTGPSVCQESLNRKLDPLLEAVEDVRDKEFSSPRRHGEEPPMGDGSGVISPIAVSSGDEINDAGDREPALDMGGATRARRLGVRRGRLPEDTLRQVKGSGSRWELVGRMLGRSVRIWREGSGDTGVNTEGAWSTPE